MMMMTETVVTRRFSLAWPSYGIKGRGGQKDHNEIHCGSCDNSKCLVVICHNIPAPTRYDSRKFRNAKDVVDDVRSKCPTWAIDIARVFLRQELRILYFTKIVIAGIPQPEHLTKRSGMLSYNPAASPPPRLRATPSVLCLAHEFARNYFFFHANVLYYPNLYGWIV